MVDSPPTAPLVHSPDLDHPEHRRAICNEIGEHLRGTLTDDLNPLPSHLEGMLKRLTELDGDAPSAVPDARPPLFRNFVSAFWRVLRHGP